MNPYLEQESVWQDFHSTYIPTLRELLNASVAPNYFVKVEEYVFIHELPADQRRPIGRADVAVGSRHPSVGDTGQVKVHPAPFRTFLPAMATEKEPHTFLSVRDRDSQSIVTVIELLSPSNKNPGADRNDYLRKRGEFFASGVHVVEIDLLRGGPRLPFDEVPPCDYLIAVSRAQDRPQVDIYPIQLREPLPQVPIPLRPSDRDATLDLQAALHRVYDAAGYANFIYRGKPQPPLSPPDAEWSRQFVHAVL